MPDFLDLRSVKRAVRSGLAPHLEPLGMVPVSDRDGWQRVLSSGLSAARVWFQYARPSRAHSLIVDGPVSKAISVRADVGFAPTYSYDSWAVASSRFGTRMTPELLTDDVRNQMHRRASAVVQSWVAGQPPYDEEFAILYSPEAVRERLGRNDMFYPLPDRDEVDYWCSIAGPVLADAVQTIIRRDEHQPTD
ncbi:hypothetical protein [Antribacter gilvus]|uniref:hypothetical protein n=1 Tax=Antribacter gilvus TaxID=2304675 RepID=UPI000F797393|nr:hypothetical protein [Antribacter gilvus]